jgi:glucan 1,3-beta-glucosidase
LGRIYKNKSTDELIALFRKYLENGIHGLCFSSYVEGQGPGSIITEEQIRKRIEIIKPYTSWIRTFSCTDGNELIPAIAKAHGLKVMVGAWLGEDKEKNEAEIENLVSACKRGPCRPGCCGQ